MRLVIAGTLAWVAVWAMWETATLPFFLSLAAFALWISSFVELERAASRPTIGAGALRGPAWSCLWTTLALGVCVLCWW